MKNSLNRCEWLLVGLIKCILLPVVIAIFLDVLFKEVSQLQIAEYLREKGREIR